MPLKSSSEGRLQALYSSTSVVKAEVGGIGSLEYEIGILLVLALARLSSLTSPSLIPLSLLSLMICADN